MIAGLYPPASDAEEEIAALVATLHATDQRLQQLTGGEIDTVTDSQGRSSLLRSAQERLHSIQAARVAAILDSLPAHIALLSPRGIIISVNQSWRRFAGANAMRGEESGVGLNYAGTCDSARGANAAEAYQAAAGIRAVLDGSTRSFSLQYPCHSPDERRWFLMTVMPLAEDRFNGAVVMHLDISAEKLAGDKLRDSELRFRQMAESMDDVFYLVDVKSGRTLYVSPSYERLSGRSCESLYRHPESWAESIYLDDRAATAAKYEAGLKWGAFEYECRIVRPDGVIRWMSCRGFPVRDQAGNLVRIAGVAKDITEHRQDEESLLRFRAAMDTTGDAITLINRATMHFVDVNATACAMFGYTREELLELEPARLRATTTDLLASDYDKLIAGEGANEVNEAVLKRKDGSSLQVEVRRHAQRSGVDWIIVGVVRDITQRKQAEAKIKRLDRVNALLSHMNALIVRVKDRDQLFNGACRIAVEQGGFRMALVGGVDPDSLRVTPLATAGVNEELTAIFKGLMASNTYDNTIVMRAVRNNEILVSNDLHRDPSILLGAQYLEYGVRSMVVLPLAVAGQVVAVMGLYAGESEYFHEVELKLLAELSEDIAFAIDHLGKQERLDYLAYYDALTGLANRNLFLERVEQLLVTAALGGHRLGLALIDLERFRNINYTLGRPAGDTLLRQVARWLSENLGDASMVARVGADQFALVMLKFRQPADAAAALEQTLKTLLEHPFHLEAAVFLISAKAGLAMFPEDGPDAATLFKHAEAALKMAKLGGERCQPYTQTISDKVAGRLTLENQLRRALERDEFVLHYQPKMCAASGKLSGAEALIRWNDPNNGLVAPGRFIPVLEETGLIYEVGRWALRQTIAEHLRWRDAGLPDIRIAVNVSPLQLRNRAYIAQIEQDLGADPRAASGVELEVTESVIMEDVNYSIASLHAIRALGLSVAIDDFGTGFSSLSYLSKLPLDTLKIDRSFVIDMTAGPQGLALVSTIIGLAHSLKLKVIAEGVETEEQSRLLRLLNCDDLQGFFFSRPLPSAEFEATFLSPVA
jgi:diguanylate cyclase (GGDEF)-like protein/PAS domain S-box-containing protein